MKLFKKTIKAYFSYLGWALIGVLVLSLVQCVILFFRLEVLTQIDVITILSFIKMGILFFTNFYLVFRKKFTLGNNFISGILFFMFSMIALFFTLLPDEIPTAFRVILYPLIFATNFIIYIGVAIVGGIAAKLFLRFMGKKKK